MPILKLCTMLQHSGVGTAVRTSLWLFPTIETVHIIGLVLVVGSIMWFDFRLLGFGPQNSVIHVAKTVKPATWWGFALAVVSGLLLFASEAIMCYSNIAFRLKMLMLLLIGVNGAYYEWITHKKVSEWDVEHNTPFSAKMTAIVSIVLWIGVIAAGRWIAYTGNA